MPERKPITGPYRVELERAGVLFGVQLVRFRGVQTAARRSVTQEQDVLLCREAVEVLRELARAADHLADVIAAGERQEGMPS